MSPRTVAKCFVGLGIAHTLVMFAMLGSVYVDMLQDGWLAAVQHDPLRAAAFWSLLFGGLLCVLGLSIPSHGLPVGAARLLTAVVFTGFVAMPATGFALALPLSVLLWRHAKSQGTSSCTS